MLADSNAQEAIYAIRERANEAIHCSRNADELRDHLEAFQAQKITHETYGECAALALAVKSHAEGWMFAELERRIFREAQAAAAKKKADAAGAASLIKVAPSMLSDMRAFVAAYEIPHEDHGDDSARFTALAAAYNRCRKTICMATGEPINGFGDHYTADGAFVAGAGRTVK